MESLNFNHLYYFTIIAKEGSIVAASRKLHLTQSTLSDQLRQLESFLKKKLFDRQARRLKLNATGQLVLNYANQIFDLSSELIDTTRQFHRKIHTKLRVGIVPELPKIYAYSFLEPLWSLENHSLIVMEANVSTLINKLKLKELDLILSDTPSELSTKHVTNLSLASHSLILVGHPSFQNLKKNLPNSLTNVPLLHYTRDSQLRQAVDSYFAHYQITPHIIGELDDTQLMRIAALNGKGLAFLPKSLVGIDLKEKKLIPIASPDFVVSKIWAIFENARLSKPLSEALYHFQDHHISDSKRS